MKIIVCIRQCSDGEISTFDACAYEAALSIPGAEVTLLSMGPSRCYDFLQKLTRLGAKRAILLSDSAFAGADTLATSYTLSLAIKREMPDLVLCGRQTTEGDTGQVGPQLAELCSLPLIGFAMEIDATSDSITVRTRDGNAVTSPYPALVTVERINKLRLPSIRSKPGEVITLDAKELGADPERIGLRGSMTRVVSTYQGGFDRRKCRFIPLSDLEAVIDEALRKEPVPLPPTVSEKLPGRVLCVGDSPLPFAETVSDHITVIGKDSAKRIAERIKKEKPTAVLWGSDPYAKITAPRVAAMLRLGLCADCIRLEAQEGILYMYRPAFSGQITAKIKALSTPAMATVRAKEKGEDIILGIGMGAASSVDALFKTAQRLGAGLGASRLAVDHDLMPYSCQVGLTGRTVCPRVYIAVGISGAVHHVAGIRDSGTVIAVNPDREAPIFDYADYGILATAEELCDKFLV